MSACRDQSEANCASVVTGCNRDDCLACRSLDDAVTNDARPPMVVPELRRYLVGCLKIFRKIFSHRLFSASNRDRMEPRCSDTALQRSANVAFNRVPFVLIIAGIAI